MSLEMLAYISIAGISIMYSVNAVTVYYQRINGSMDAYGYFGLAESINTAILQNAASVTAYVPAGLCNSTIDGSELTTTNGKVYFIKEIQASMGVLCGPGTRRLNISYGGGTIRLG